MARRTRRFSRILSSLAVAGAGLASVHAPACAAELGEAKVASHIGQLLVADIELTAVDDPSTPVQVRLASPEVYNGAGIAMPKVLSMMNLSVVKRDGRQAVHVTTLLPVNADHLHVYLELVDKGQRVVRLATLWLTPDPNPAPPVVPPAPAPAPAPAAVPAAAAVSAPVPKPPLPIAKPPAAVPAAIPAPAPPAPKLPRPVAKLPPALAHAPSHPPACVKSAEEAKACTALGERNAELRARIGTLEERVKGLQAQLGAPAAQAAHGEAPKEAASKEAAKKEEANEEEVKKDEAKKDEAKKDEAKKDGAKPQEAGKDAAHAKPEPEPEAGAPKPEETPEAKPEAKPAAPKPISSIKPLVPRKPKDKPAEADAGLPWGWIGGAGALLALGGGAAAWLARRRKVPNVDIPGEPGAFDKLKERFAARNRPAAAPQEPAREAEPTLE